MKTSVGGLSVSPKHLSLKENADDESIPLLRAGLTSKAPYGKVVFVGVFSFLVLRDGFLKAGQTQVGVMCLVVSMNFDFFPCLYYKESVSGESAA